MIGGDLTDSVIGCVIRVHQGLGPGFIESIYRRALAVELRNSGLCFELEKEVFVHYRGIQVGRHRLDILVEDELILELKAVETLTSTHYAQTRSYLKATGLKDALLINFAHNRADFRRVTPQRSSLNT